MSVNAYTGETPKLPFETGDRAAAAAGPNTVDTVKSLLERLDSDEQPDDDQEEQDESGDDRDDEEDDESSDDDQDDADDEDKDEEDDQDDEEEDEETEDEDDADQPDAKKLHKFKADGEEHEVPYEELTRLASAGMHLTKKSQALATKVKEVEAKDAEIVQKLTDSVAGLKKIEAVLKELAPEPDWDKLREEDPDAFASAWAQHDQRTKAQAKIEAARVAAETELAQKAAEAHQKLVDAETEKLKEAIPELKDEKKGTAVWKGITAFLKSEALGFTDELINAVSDHRLFVMAHDAMKWQELQKKGGKLREKIKSAPKAAPPSGRTRGEAGKGDLSRRMERLRKSNSEADAVEIIKRII